MGEKLSYEIFPIKLRAYETPHYTSSPHQYRAAFMAAWRADTTRTRRNDSWYAFDATIVSRTEVEFVAYHMRDSFSGGIGDECWRGKATVAADLTANDIERAIFKAAAERRDTERRAEELAIIERYADEIRAILTQKGE